MVRKETFLLSREGGKGMKTTLYLTLICLLAGCGDPTRTEDGFEYFKDKFNYHSQEFNRLSDSLNKQTDLRKIDSFLILERYNIEREELFYKKMYHSK